MFEIKFLKDCSGFEFSSSLDRSFKDSCLHDSIETLALVSDGVIYDYGVSVDYSDINYHHVLISNDSMNHFAIFFGKLYLGVYTDLKCLNNFFQRFIEEL